MEDEGLVDELGSFADDIGLFYEELGYPRVWGRVLGWLLVCQPNLQSADDLAAALHASRGSISMATQGLIRAGMVERQTLRGDRRTFYRIRPGSWTALFEEQTRMATKLGELAERGLSLLNDEPPERRHRVEELHDLTAFYEHEAPLLLERWHKDDRHAAGKPR
jgi:DNA-binding transcriptional regulator GbsR (MarR family)